MNGPILWIFIASILIFSWATEHYLARKAKQSVYNRLTGAEATQIVVKSVGSKRDKDDLVFDVEYVDRHGNYHRTQCKVLARFWDETETFWQESPDL